MVDDKSTITMVSPESLQFSKTQLSHTSDSEEDDEEYYQVSRSDRTSFDDAFHRCYVARQMETSRLSIFVPSQSRYLAARVRVSSKRSCCTKIALSSPADRVKVYDTRYTHARIMQYRMFLEIMIFTEEKIRV